MQDVIALAGGAPSKLEISIGSGVEPTVNGPAHGVIRVDGVTGLNATRPGTIHVIPAGSDGAEAMQTLLGDDTVARMMAASKPPD